MSREAARRLEQIENALTPQQAVLLWQEQAHGHGSLPAYIATLRDAPIVDYPLVALPETVGHAAWKRYKGRPIPAREQALMRDVREVVFLWYLLLELNLHILCEQQALWLQLAGATRDVRELLAIPADPEHMPQRVRRAQNQCQSVATEIIVWTGTIRRFADHYFAGASPLFPESAVELTDLNNQANYLVEVLREATTVLTATSPPPQAPGPSLSTQSAPMPPSPKPIVFTALQSGARSQVTARMQNIATIARTKAALFVGDQNYAIALMGPQVWRDVARWVNDPNQ